MKRVLIGFCLLLFVVSLRVTAFAIPHIVPDGPDCCLYLRSVQVTDGNFKSQ